MCSLSCILESSCAVTSFTSSPIAVLQVLCRSRSHHVQNKKECYAGHRWPPASLELLVMTNLSLLP